MGTAGVSALALVLGFLVMPGTLQAHAANQISFGEVISTLNHTNSAVATAQSLTSVPATSLVVQDISFVVVPPGPPCFVAIEGGSTCRINAFEQAVGRNANDILALRTALSQTQVTTCIVNQDVGGTQCTSTAMGDYLNIHSASMDQVVALIIQGSNATLWIMHPPNPCVQSPLEFCPN